MGWFHGFKLHIVINDKGEILNFTITQGNEMAILKSKGVGEPPLMYGIGAYFAIQNAVKAFNKNYKPEFHAPFTPEKVLMSLYEK